MAVLSFNGNTANVPITNTAGDVLIQSDPDFGVIIRLNDNTGTKKLSFQNDVAEIAYIRSDGAVSFPDLSATISYTASPSAGAIAASKTNTTDALDTLFPGDHMVWNETSQDTCNGVRTNFRTVDDKVWIPTKVMVFRGGMKQRPTEDYNENVNRFSVDFVDPPPSGQNIEFTYIRG